MELCNPYSISLRLSIFFPSLSCPLSIVLSCYSSLLYNKGGEKKRGESIPNIEDLGYNFLASTTLHKKSLTLIFF